MNNTQNCDSYINIVPSSQTYGSILLCYNENCNLNRDYADFNMPYLTFTIHSPANYTIRHDCKLDSQRPAEY
jgi:hypothetical protein